MTWADRIRLLRKTALQALVLCAFAIVPALLTAFFHPDKPEWDPTVLKEGETNLPLAISWGDEVLWVDARSREDYDKEHIPGAVLLTEDDWDEEIEDVLNEWLPEMKVVVYCSSLACQESHKVRERLLEYGLTEVYVLKGGWETWKAAVE
jgi:rhodanese-related sulfurtransferase